LEDGVILVAEAFIENINVIKFCLG